jgi:tetratricopeptide (TPR) repeat protein
MYRVASILLTACLFAGIASAKVASRPAHWRSETLPVSTRSARARALFNQANTDFGNLHLAKALDGWRAAAKVDPKFAQAYVQVAFNSKDPAEQTRMLNRAKALAPRVTPSERLLIRWVADVLENRYVAGIQAMNDLCAMYPRDKALLYLAGNWLVLQENYDGARKFMERALAVDPKYPPALNDLGYAYAYLRDYPQAISAMERYVAALPGEPNPNDSFAEILRLSGDFEGALQHYRAALTIDPKFAYSQLGIADTYALMGDEERARAEYRKAIEMAPLASDRVEFGQQSAMTWIRERKYPEADTAFLALASEARELGLSRHEAAIHRMMAQYQQDPTAALQHLATADALLSAGKDLLKTDVDEEHARILQWRALYAQKSGDRGAADQALHELHLMQEASRSSVIWHAYNAANGAVLAARGKYEEAIPYLQEDQMNAFSVRELAAALEKTGARQQAEEEQKLLLSTNTPTLDDAVAVVAARASRAAAAPERQ